MGCDPMDGLKELLRSLRSDRRLDVTTQNRIQEELQLLEGARYLLRPTPGGFVTTGGFWRPASPLAALQLARLACQPNQWVRIDAYRPRRAVHNALVRAAESLAGVDPELAELFRPAAARNALGLHLSVDGRWVLGELRLRFSCISVFLP